MHNKEKHISIYDKIKIIVKQEKKKKSEHAQKVAHLFEEEIKHRP